MVIAAHFTHVESFHFLSYLKGRHSAFPQMLKSAEHAVLLISYQHTEKVENTKPVTGPSLCCFRN